MRRIALLALVAWRLVLAAAMPAPDPQSADEDPEPLSNIELLIPLLVGERGESYPRAQHAPRPDDDAPYSGIPADAFTLDDDIRVPPAPRAPPRQRDPGRPRVRSLYLQPAGADSGGGGGGGDGEREAPHRRRDQLRRACERLERAGEALLYLCRELVELADSAPAPAPAPTPRACPCCGADVAPLWLRRDFMPLGENSYMVQRYMNVQHKRPPPPWFTEQ